MAAIVDKYIGKSPVPPCWGRLGVRGTFGKDVERLWARHIRPLRLATYRDERSGRMLTPAMQTFYDFGTTPENGMRMMGTGIEARSAITKGSRPLVILDEAHLLMSR